jgi:hypothetical protein
VDTEKVLSHFREVLRDIHAEAVRHGPQLGSPPMSIIVEQRTPSPHAGFNTGTTLRRWRVTAEGTTALTQDEPLPAQTRIGMYYDCGRADFSVDENGGKVRVGWQVGPRYGRGYDLPIERAADGSVRLGRPSALWVS